MTTEPKFIPKEAAELELAEGIRAKVRLIDCVGLWWKVLRDIRKTGRNVS